MTTAAAPESFVFDVASLEALKRRARQAPQQTQKEVAQQFEALFVQMMLKRMREATPKDGLFDSDQTRMLQSVLDEQMAQQLAKPGIGLAQALLAQMQRGQPASAEGAQPVDGVAAADAAFQPPKEAFSLFDNARRAGGASPSHAVGALLNIIRTGPTEAARERAHDEGVPEHVVNFVAKLAGPARAVAEASGLPLRLILGQAALESGWGKREIRLADGSASHNLFGIKATGGWDGKVAEVLTTEYQDGVARKMVQPFRAYESYEHALADYARLITRNERYQPVVSAVDENDAARKIQAAGYATDPAYADKLIQVMQQLPV